MSPNLRITQIADKLEYTFKVMSFMDSDWTWKVLDALSKGFVYNWQIAKETGLNRNHVSQIRGRLLEFKLIESDDSQYPLRAAVITDRLLKAAEIIKEMGKKS
ncbi:MAG: hypothetical protein IPO16_14970 [Saprospiraceae bacterium]|nr:hypothetical protein [Saprospiraceae bacterium]